MMVNLLTHICVTRPQWVKDVGALRRGWLLRPWDCQRHTGIAVCGISVANTMKTLKLLLLLFETDHVPRCEIWLKKQKCYSSLLAKCLKNRSSQELRFSKQYMIQIRRQMCCLISAPEISVCLGKRSIQQNKLCMITENWKSVASTPVDQKFWEMSIVGLQCDTKLLMIFSIIIQFQ